jgi:hypothetical protein
MPRRSVRATVALLALPAALFFAGPASAGRRSLMARDLGAFEGDDTIGTALNDRGQMVGVTGSGVSQSAFLLDGAGTVNLGQVAAVDINNGGQILLQTVAGNPDAVVGVGLRLEIGLLAVGAVLLAVHEQEIAHDARLVAVRARILEMNLRDHARLARVGHVQDRGAELRAVREVADVGVVAYDTHLPGARQVEMS